MDWRHLLVRLIRLAYSMVLSSTGTERDGDTDRYTLSPRFRPVQRLLSTTAKLGVNFSARRCCRDVSSTLQSTCLSVAEQPDFTCKYQFRQRSARHSSDPSDWNSSYRKQELHLPARCLQRQAVWRTEGTGGKCGPGRDRTAVLACRS